MIPEAAVEAALSALFHGKKVHGFTRAVQEPIIRTILEAAAPHMRATALRDAAEEFAARLPGGTGNGRAYNSHQVASILRAKAAELRAK